MLANSPPVTEDAPPHRATLLDSPPASPPGSTSAPTPVRLRSVPYRKPFVSAQVLAVINYICAVAVMTCVPILLLQPTPHNVKILLGCVAACVVAGLVSFLNRRKVLCPLCKGTPLVSSKARIHPKATRIFPLDYGTSTMLTLIFTQTFRCMYCASRFDLLKERPDQRKPLETPEDPS